MTDSTVKFASMSLEVAAPGHSGFSPDDIDWAIMEGSRKLAQELELFDPAMYGACAGRLVHGHACEMSPGDFMILDIFESKVVRGLASPHRYGEGDGAVVPNHYCIVVLLRDHYILTLSTGRYVPDAIPGIPISFTADDPQCLR